MEITFDQPKPSLPGSYWFRTRDTDGVLVSIIRDDQGTLRAAAMLPDTFHLRPVIELDRLDGEWSAAIEIPADPAENAPVEDAPAEDAPSTDAPSDATDNAPSTEADQAAAGDAAQPPV